MSTRRMDLNDNTQYGHDTFMTFRYRQRTYLNRVFLTSLILCLFLLAACSGGNDESPFEPTEEAHPIATVDSALPTPQPVIAEQNLEGMIPDIPDIFIVPSRQSKAALASYLKTTVPIFNWVNPGLPDPIPSDTVVVIPPIYKTTQGETLSEIAEKTTIPVALLSAANPAIKEQKTFDDGTFLSVPPLYIVPEDTLLAETANALQTSSETLLSANPNLLEQESIRSGTVLIVPREEVDE